MKAIYHAANPIDAQLVVDLLADAEVAAHVQGLFLTGGVGELPAGDMVRVWVADDDVIRARAALAGQAREAAVEGALDPALVASWRRAWCGLGLDRPDAETGRLALRDALVQAWSEPHRRYHSLRHLLECISLLEVHLRVADRPAEVEMALWFHDAIYALRARDNEARSADWAATALQAAGLDAAACARIHALVMATRHAALPVGIDQCLVVDVDLAILGADTERFDEYQVQVRQEYAWVPAPLFRAKRKEILVRLLARESIYSTPELHASLEEPARANLKRALARLRPWYQLFA